MSKAKQQAQEYKEKGNKSFASEKYSESITWYTKAIQSDPSDHVLYSNRSAAYLKEKERRREGERERERGGRRGRRGRERGWER